MEGHNFEFVLPSPRVLSLGREELPLPKPRPGMSNEPRQLLGESWVSVCWCGWSASHLENHWKIYYLLISLVAQMVKNLPAMRKTQVQSLGWEDPLRRKWQPTPVFLPEKSHGQRSLEGYHPWGHKESRWSEQLSTHRRIPMNSILSKSKVKNSWALPLFW